MNVFLEPCAGRDVHQGTVTACIRYSRPVGGIVQSPSGVLEDAADPRGDGVVAAFKAIQVASVLPI